MFETLLDEWVNEDNLKSKKDEYISGLEDFIELMCALCPNEEELIKYKGNELIQKFNKV